MKSVLCWDVLLRTVLILQNTRLELIISLKVCQCLMSHSGVPVYLLVCCSLHPRLTFSRTTPHSETKFAPHLIMPQSGAQRSMSDMHRGANIGHKSGFKSSSDNQLVEDDFNAQGADLLWRKGFKSKYKQVTPQVKCQTLQKISPSTIYGKLLASLVC